MSFRVLMVLATSYCVVGCGSRTGLDVDLAGRAEDAAIDARVDAALDANLVVDCLWHEGVGFLTELPRLLPREPTVENTHPALSGHGDTFFIATEEDGGGNDHSVRLDRLDKLGRWKNLVYRFAEGRQPTLIPSADGQRVLLAMYRGQNAYLVEWSVNDLLITNEVEFEVSSRVFSSGAIQGTHNGRDWILLLPPDDDGQMFGAVDWSRSFPVVEWGRGIRPGPISSDPNTGRVFVQANDADATNTVRVFTQDSVELNRINFQNFGAIHWIGEWPRTEGPFVALGTTPISVARLLEDGTEVSRFSDANFLGAGGTRSIALATGPIAGYAFSYGVLSFRRSGLPPLAFHGAVEDEERGHVSNLIELDEVGPLDMNVSLAAGECGYLLAWDKFDGKSDVGTRLIYPGRGS